MNINNITLFFAIAVLLSVVLGCGESMKTPKWEKATILSEKVDHPNAVTTDDKFIYYVTGGTIASLNEGTSGVWKMPLAGGPPTQLFKGHYIDKDTVFLPDTFVLTTDEKYVYWSSGEIWRTPKDGGESEKITSGKPTEWAIDETKIYWHNFGGENAPPKPIYFADKKGGEAKPLTEPVITTGIVVDKEFLYWAQSDGIYKIPKIGGEKSKVYSAPEKQFISGMIDDKDNFYFTQGNGSNALFKVAKTGGEAVKLAPSINHVHKFYTDETNIYYVLNEGSSSTSINKIAKSGGESTKLDSGYIASYTLAKDKIFVTDIANIYALGK